MSAGAILFTLLTIVFVIAAIWALGFMFSAPVSFVIAAVEDVKEHKHHKEEAEAAKH